MPADDEGKRRRRGIIGRVLRRLTDIINDILDSHGFIPGGEAVKEIKGAIAGALP